MAWVALCAACTGEVGDEGWCDGHRDEGRGHRAWAAALPAEWPTVARLWWAATGEISVDADWLRLARDEVDVRIRTALP